MKEKKIGFTIFVGSMILFVTLFMAISLWHRMELMQVPLIISTPTLALLIYVLYSKKNQTDKKDENPVPEKSLLKILIWIIGFFCFILFFGFYISIPILTFLFISIELKNNLIHNLFVSFGISTTIIFIFHFLFKIELWTGFIPEIIPNILGGGILPPI